MSYTRPQPRHASATSIDVGTRAYADPVLAWASLESAKIVESAARVPPSKRLDVMRTALDKRGAGLWRETRVLFKDLVAKGKSADQAAFDAMRVTLANRRMTGAVERARIDIAGRRGWDAVLDSPLGDLSPSDRQAACVAAGAGTTVGGALQIIPVYGTLVGGILGIGGAVAGGALDCGRETREAASRLATAEAAEAQARLDRLAAQEATVARERASKQKLLLVGGGILAAVLIVSLI